MNFRSLKANAFGSKRGWDPVLDGKEGENYDNEYHQDSGSSQEGFRKDQFEKQNISIISYIEQRIIPFSGVSDERVK